MTGQDDDKDDKAHNVVNHEDDDVNDKIWDAEDAIEILARKSVVAAVGGIG